MTDVKIIDKGLTSLEAISKQAYNSSPFQQPIDSIRALLHADQFRIAVVGEFSAGKSTFINALIGYDLLPHARSETTATITYIHNVPHNDPRCGTIAIEFIDGRESVTLNISTDKNALKEYVTTLSNQFCVVDEIKHVNVYTKFLNIDKPVVLIDTPGLNGTADGHRSITLSEVERAHTSIFLFHLRGLTDTDLDFLQLLAKHQSRIFYLLNHIDVINEREGETVDKVLNDFQQQISSHFSSSFSKGNEPETFAVSALQALVHKDPSLKKLYSSDLHELTESERVALWQTSRFSDFEQTLQHYVHERSKQDIEVAALKGLNSLIRDIEDNIQQEIACIEQQETCGRDERVSAYLHNLPTRKAQSWQKISTYLKRRTEVLQNDASGYLSQALDDLNETLSQQIHALDLDQLQQNAKRNDYGSKITQGVSHIRSRMQKLLQSNIEEIYELGIIETDKFTSEIKIDYSKTHKISKLTFSVDNDIAIHEEQKLQKEKQKLNDLAFDLKNTAHESQQFAQQDKKLTQDLASHQSELAQLAKRKESALQRMGSRPKIEYRTKTRAVERDGFFGSVIDFFHEKKETYREADRSAQRRYDSEQDRIQREYAAQLQILNRKQDQLVAKRDEARATIAMSQQDITSIEQKISKQQRRINEMEQHLATKLRNHRQQITRELRKELSEQVDQSLKGDVLSALSKKISAAIRNELATVSTTLSHYHQRKFDLYRQKLERLDGQIMDYDLPRLKDALKALNSVKQDLLKK